MKWRKYCNSFYQHLKKLSKNAPSEKEYCESALVPHKFALCRETLYTLTSPRIREAFLQHMWVVTLDCFETTRHVWCLWHFCPFWRRYVYVSWLTFLRFHVLPILIQITSWSRGRHISIGESSLNTTDIQHTMNNLIVLCSVQWVQNWNIDLLNDQQNIVTQKCAETTI